MHSPINDQKETQLGIYYTMAAFFMWGLVPIYFKQVAHVAALEVIVHRVIWSCLFLALVIVVSQGTRQTWHYLKQRNLMLSLLLCAVVISINWFVFIWAVAQGRIVETSLGYYINPLINIIFGFLFFSERLRKWQVVAIAIAAVGVLYQVILLGEFPWISLALALSFATYGALRKHIKIDATNGLFIETLWLSPIALLLMFWIDQQGLLAFSTEDPSTLWLLLAAGLVTSLPLLAFAAGARRISLTLVGVLQYIGPSMSFLIAVFYYDEPMDIDRLITFALIWCALALFTLEGWVFHKKRSPVKQ